MDPSYPVLIRWQGKSVGPFSTDQLRELIATGAVTPATEVALEPEGPWVCLDTVPLGRVLFPKAPTYERANNNADSAPIHLHDLIAAAQTPTSATPPPSVPAPAVSAEHDVASILRHNQATEQNHGLFALAPKRKRRSRRRRDYIILLCGAGLPLFLILFGGPIRDAWTRTHSIRILGEAGPILAQVLLDNPFVAVWAIGGFIFYAVALSWIMFVLMDDY